MTAVTLSRPTTFKPLVDGITITRRNLVKVKRVPDLLVFSTISPIMFILLFAYVFGGSIHNTGVSYHEYLIPGVFVQTVIFGSTFTGMGMAEDMQKGIIDRFRSLPMAQSAVLVGRTTSDALTNVLMLVIMSLTGLIVGWRIRGSVFDALGAYLLLLLFAYAMSWIMACVGLAVAVPEVVNNASFVVIFPMTFIANTFVAASSLPHGLRVVADWNPVSAVTQEARVLFGNTSSTVSTPHDWPLRHAAAYSIIWVFVILAIFVPLAVRLYKRAASR
jgi:ABC-2 type transport system permease protein